MRSGFLVLGSNRPDQRESHFALQIMGNGWIKLHRKLLENPISNRPLWGWLWVVLLLKANHERKEIIWNGKPKTIEAGSFLTGRKVLAEETGLSETTIERILDYLVLSRQIGQQKTNKYRLISIVKWKEYQVVGQQTDNKRTTGGHKQEAKEIKKRHSLEEKPPTQEEKALAQKIKEDLTERFKIKS